MKLDVNRLSAHLISVVFEFRRKSHTFTYIFFHTSSSWLRWLRRNGRKIPVCILLKTLSLNMAASPTTCSSSLWWTRGFSGTHATNPHWSCINTLNGNSGLFVLLLCWRDSLCDFLHVHHFTLVSPPSQQQAGADTTPRSAASRLTRTHTHRHTHTHTLSHNTYSLLHNTGPGSCCPSNRFL